MHEDLLNADLCLIPKPGKPPDKLSNLRPLGILRPDGKGLAGATRTALAPCIAGSLAHLPQFAYLPGRGLSVTYERLTSSSEKLGQVDMSCQSGGGSHLRPGL